MNNPSPIISFIEDSLLHSQHCSSVEIRRMKTVLDTANAEASCCSILMSAVVVEAEIYITDNKRSLYLSEYRKNAD